jgi:hypothetical protein
MTKPLKQPFKDVVLLTLAFIFSVEKHATFCNVFVSNVTFLMVRGGQSLILYPDKNVSLNEVTEDISSEINSERIF